MSKGVFLFNHKYELTHTIPADDLTENYMDAELNGLITGGFTTTDIRDYEEFDYFGVKEENNFWLFKIRSIVKDMDRIRIHGVHIMFDELQGKIIRDSRPRKAPVNTVLLNILKDTGWSPGFVVTSSPFSGSFYFQSVLSALYEVCGKSTVEFQPVIKFSDGKIVSKTINVYDQISDDYGKIFKYGDNLLKVVAETKTDDIYTRFIGRGKGEEVFDENGQATAGFGRKIRFDTIDYTNIRDGITVRSPIGQDYIELSQATAQYGYPDGSPREVVVDFDNIEDRKELADATFEYALENCRPKVQLKASGLQYEKVELGETVTIIGQMDIRYKTRVFKIKKDFLREKVVSFEFGDKLVKTMADRIKQGQAAEKEREITEQNYMKAMIAMVESSFFNEDGYQYDLKADNEYNLPAGFYSFNKPIDENPTKVIYFGAGKLMIANSKKSDGSWDFSVAIDGDAVNANVIRAGILKGGRVEWDLQNGTFLIGKSTSDYKFFWDGDVLRMRNVDIDLKNNYDFNNYVEGMDSRLNNLQNEFNGAIADSNRQLGSKILSVEQDFKLGQGQLSSTISSTRQEIEKNLSDNYDTKSQVNAKINTADNNIKTYISNNYSSITQTDNKIRTEVGSVRTAVQTDINAGISATKSVLDRDISGVKTDLANNYDTKSEVNQKINNADRNLRTFISQNYSSITQTDEKIESIVSRKTAEISESLAGKLSRPDFTWNLVRGSTDILFQNMGDYVISIEKSKMYSGINELDMADLPSYEKFDIKFFDNFTWESGKKYYFIRVYITSLDRDNSMKADLIEGQEYTLTWDVYNPNANKVSLQILNDLNTTENIDMPAKTFKKINYKFTYSSKYYITLRFFPYAKSYSKGDMVSLVLGPPKIEAGNKESTYWTPHISDINNSTVLSKLTQTSEGFESQVEKINNAIYGGGYDKNGNYISTSSSLQSKITQTAEEISSKVSKNGVISAINQSSEYVKIQASKIQLDGNVMLTGDFISKSSGTISSLKNGELRFEKEYDKTLGSSIGLSNLPGSNTYMTTWTHDYEGAMAIGSRTKGIEVDGTRYLSQIEPYILFDRNGYARSLHQDHYFDEMIINAQTAFVDFATFDKQAYFKSGIAIDSEHGTIKLGKWEIYDDGIGNLVFEHSGSSAHYYLSPKEYVWREL